MTQKLLIYVLILNGIMSSCISFAIDDKSATWKGNYYAVIPNQPGVSQKYCDEHLLGSFTHKVKDAVAHSIMTDNGIEIKQATFYEKKEHGIYFIYGDFLAIGKTKNKQWEDHIYYYLTKLTELGVTKGVWSSEKCKGLYRGSIVK